MRMVWYNFVIAWLLLLYFLFKYHLTYLNGFKKFVSLQCKIYELINDKMNVSFSNIFICAYVQNNQDIFEIKCHENDRVFLYDRKL